MESGDDNELAKRREQWTFIPQSNMTITLHEDAGSIPAGLVLSVPFEVGRTILCRRLGKIIERDDVTIDAVIESTLEEFADAIELTSEREKSL